MIGRAENKAGSLAVYLSNPPSLKHPYNCTDQFIPFVANQVGPFLDDGTLVELYLSGYHGDAVPCGFSPQRA